jgi:anti-sigma regulatory factor (Ser/Thr protein kinase)
MKWGRAVGVAAENLEGVALAVGEAAANAVEHSGSDTVAMHLRTAGDSAEVVIRDFGAWREPSPPASDGDLLARGRGLKLMSAFCDVQVDGRADGTDVTLRVPREGADSPGPAPAARVEALAGSG